MKKSILIYSVLLITFFLSVPAYSQIILTIAGNGTPGYTGDSGPAISAELYQPYGVALDDTGNLYICDVLNRCIRKVSPAYGGVITTIAGNGTPGYSADDGLGIYAQIDGSYYIAIDHRGNVFIDDGDNIRKITPSDTITTIAGTGLPGFSGDSGPATAAQLYGPQGITADSIGNLYFADAGNYRIRKIDTAGIISTIAGTGIAGFSPDGALADTATLNNLLTVESDRTGNLFFSDNYRIRKISSGSGIITTVAGNGTPGYSGDAGMATASEIDPAAIAIDSFNNLFMADPDANRIRKVNTAGIINTIAGSAMGGYGGDGGNPLLAKLCGSQGVTVSNSGDIYIGDVCNNRIRLVTIHPLGLNNAPVRGQGISIFPNPSGGEFTFLISSNTQEQALVIITNIFGEKIKELSVKTNEATKIQINVPSGVYYISATTDQKQFNEKIIVQ